MAYTTIFIILCAFLAPGVAETARCREVSAINCDTHYTPDGDERVCCSDFEDYPNLCHFAQKKCKDPSLTILNLGPCSFRTSESSQIKTTTPDNINTPTVDLPIDATHSTSDPPTDSTLDTSDATADAPGILTTTPPTHRSQPTIQKHPNCTDVICSVFCSQVDSIPCSKDLDPVCGTDGKFYQNECELAKARCKDIGLTKQDLLLCKVARRHKRELAFV